MYVKNLNEKNRQEIIKKLFAERYKINLDVIERSNNKSSDFKYVKDGKTIFVAELKTLEWVRPSEKIVTKKGIIKWQQTKVGKDNNPSKIAHLVKEAHSQLISYKEPKILIYFNESIDCDFLDLISALTGNLIFYDKNNPTDQETYNLYKHIANGEIKEKKKDIDLYIWIEIPDGIRNFDFKINFLPINTKGEYIFSQYFTIKNLIL